MKSYAVDDRMAFRLDHLNAFDRRRLPTQQLVIGRCQALRKLLRCSVSASATAVADELVHLWTRQGLPAVRADQVKPLVERCYQNYKRLPIAGAGDAAQARVASFRRRSFRLFDIGRRSAECAMRSAERDFLEASRECDHEKPPPSRCPPAPSAAKQTHVDCAGRPAGPTGPAAGQPMRLLRAGEDAEPCGQLAARTAADGKRKLLALGGECALD